MPLLNSPAPALPPFLPNFRGIGFKPLLNPPFLFLQTGRGFYLNPLMKPYLFVTSTSFLVIVNNFTYQKLKLVWKINFNKFIIVDAILPSFV